MSQTLRRWGGKTERERRARRAIGGDFQGPEEVSDFVGTTFGTHFPFSSGADSSLAISSDTTLALGANVLRLTTLTIDPGYTLKSHASDHGIFIYCSQSATLGSGAAIRPSVGGGGAGGFPPGGGGDGGNGGDASAFVGLFSLYINNLGVIVGGWPGVNGQNGGASSGAANGDSGSDGTDKSIFFVILSAAG